MPSLMKGHPLKRALKKLQFPMIAEPKEDEVRCRVLVNGGVYFWSYAGKPLHNLERFAPLFLELARKTGIYEFDTGFHVVDFDTTYRWVRSSKGLKADLQAIAADVPRFILFDLPTSTLPYIERCSLRRDVCEVACELGLRLEAPVAIRVNSLADTMGWYERWRAAGLEGAMLKTEQHLYQRDRSWDWLKVKPSEDADGVIFDLVEAVSDTDDHAKGLYKGKELGRVGSVGIRMEDGSTAYAHGVKHGLGKVMFERPQDFLGQWAELEFMERDRQGGYRHPVFKRIREAKA